jgi:hypothetical protein
VHLRVDEADRVCALALPHILGIPTYTCTYNRCILQSCSTQCGRPGGHLPSSLFVNTYLGHRQAAETKGIKLEDYAHSNELSAQGFQSLFMCCLLNGDITIVGPRRLEAIGQGKNLDDEPPHYWQDPRSVMDVFDEQIRSNRPFLRARHTLPCPGLSLLRFVVFEVPAHISASPSLIPFCPVRSRKSGIPVLVRFPDRDP